MSLSKSRVRPTLGSVIGRGHLIVALVAITMASVSLTLLGVLALRVYADHNLHLIARSINYTVEAAVVFDDAAAATEALALIASTEEVADAQVFNEHGRLLARWKRPDTGLLSELEMHIAKAFWKSPSVCRSFIKGGTSAAFYWQGMVAACCAFCSAVWRGSFCARR